MLYLCIDFFIKKSKKQSTEHEAVDKKQTWFYRSTVGLIGNFWATVALVEIMDLAFSIDNVFAAVAFTDNIYLIYVGVFIGILAMRFVAQGFVKLMERFTFLESIAFLVIGILGLKLCSSILTHLHPDSPVSKFMDSEKMDMLVSIITVCIFVIPVLSSILFNFPKKHKVQED